LDTVALQEVSSKTAQDYTFSMEMRMLLIT